MKKTLLYVFFAFLITLTACGNSSNDYVPTISVESSVEERTGQEQSEDKGETKMKVTAISPLKSTIENNPVMTQRYSADPYAMVYDGRVYLYMTGDEPMYDAAGNLVTNNYSNIDTIRIVSSDDLVNWTDHGEVHAAGKNGEAKWGSNSWAPAACWKMIDGKPKFFLYFANGGNGIAVLTADSPVGPFTDPIGQALVSRSTPNCASVSWLFDPAVLVDDDGTGYLYFGGGIPNQDMVSNPGTARVVRLTDDMVHLDCDPIPIENVLYLFEDSGINKINGKYVYSYCSNFNVPATGCEGYGFGSGEIITMVGDDPMGPFETVGSILKNPGFFFSYGGNNHHCIFTFNDKWYITYHANLVAEKLKDNKGYRNVNIDEAKINEDGTVARIQGTKAGVKQVKTFNPFEEQSFATMANQAGITTVAADASTKKTGCGNMNVVVEQDGGWISVKGVDFGNGATKLVFTLKANSKGSISVRTKSMNGDDAGRLDFEAGSDFSEYTLTLDTPFEGEHSVIYFVFEGVGIELKSYRFE